MVNTQTRFPFGVGMSALVLATDKRGQIEYIDGRFFFVRVGAKLICLVQEEIAPITFCVVDTQTGQIVGTRNSFGKAYRQADLLDIACGDCRYVVREKILGK